MQPNPEARPITDNLLSWPQSVVEWVVVPPADDDPGASIGATVARVLSDEDSGTTDSMRRLGLHTVIAPDQAASQNGRTSEGYTVRALVATGGCGEVWLADQNSLKRVVALKAIRGTLEQSKSPQTPASEALERAFQLEAMTTARLEHPNIVPVYDFGTDDRGKPVMAMKLVRGESWDVVLKRDFTSLAVDDYLAKHLEILLSAMQAVAFAHSRGIVHRDLKPNQVMLGEFGEVLLMDWGLAIAVPPGPDTHRDDRRRFILDGIATTDNAANPCGTPCYMAPEQTLTTAAEIGFHTDVYLLGAILYQILTGSVPRRSGNVQETMRLAAEGVVYPMEVVAGGRYIPQGLAQIALNALSVDPAKRQPSVLVLINDIRGYLSGASNRAQSESILAQTLSRYEALGQLVSSGGQTSPESIYSECAECLSELSRASSLWSRNPGVEPVRASVLELYATTALKNRDLLLARGLTRLMEQSPRRNALLAQVAQLERLAEQQRFQRRLMIYGLILLLALHGVGSYMYFSLQQRAKERLGEERDLADTARRAAERTQLLAASQQSHAERDQYFASISAADANIEKQRADNAIRLLVDDTKPSLRQWEWGLLARRAMGDRIGMVPANFVASLAFSPDGSKIYSGSRDGSVHVFGGQTGRYEEARSYFNGRLYEVRPSPDGNRLLLTSFENYALVTDARTGTVLQRLLGHTQVMRGGAWSPDGAMIATTSYDHTALIFDANSGKLLRRLADFTEGTNGCQFDRDGRSLFVFGDDGTAAIYELTSGTRTVTFGGHGKPVRDGKFSPDFSTVATACGDGAVRVFDVQSGRLARTITYFDSTPYVVCFVDGGRSVAAVLEDGQGLIHDVSTGELRAKFIGEGLPRELHVSPDGKFLGVAGRFYVRLLSLATLLDKASQLNPASYVAGGAADVRIPVYGVTPGRDPQWHQMERPWNTTAGLTALSARGRTVVAESRYMVFTPDGKYRFDIDPITLIGRATDTATGRAVYTPPNAKLAMAAFSPDGRWLAVVNPVDRIHIVDTATWKEARVLSHDAGTSASRAALDRYLVAHVAWSPDSRALAVPYLNGRMVNWDVLGGSMISETDYTYGLGACAAFDSTGTTIAIGQNDDRISLWDARSGRLERMMRGHTRPVSGVSFSPDNTRLVSFARDRTVRLWDVASGREIMVIQTTPDGKLPVGAQFTRDGKSLVVLVNDGTVTVHDSMPWAESAYDVGGLTTATLPQRIELYNRRQLLGPQVTADDVLWVPTVPTSRFTSATLASPIGGGAKR